jgi:pilus assembly protein Flp/PilA
VKQILTRMYRDEKAATAVEYCLIAGLIALAIIAGAQSLGTSLNDKYSDFANKVDGH